SFAFGHQGAEAISRIVISGLNTNPDWFKRAELRVDGQGIERIGDHTYQLRVPQRGDVPVQLAINTPRMDRGQNHTSLIPEVFAQSPPPTDKPPTGDNKGGSDIVKERDERLHKMYGNRPIILVEGLSQAFFETTPGQAGQGGKVQLYRPTSYVAFVIDDQATPTPTPAVNPQGGKNCGCGKSTANGFIFSTLVTIMGLSLVWRRTRRRAKNGKTEKDG
ncbi:MAG: hypothetical protein WCD76_21395, partial [Pyrinomonadaceae bacterium]